MRGRYPRPLSVVLAIGLVLGGAGGASAEGPTPTTTPVPDEVLGDLSTVIEATGALGLYRSDSGEYVVVVPKSHTSTFQASRAAALGIEVRVETRDIEQSEIDSIVATLTARNWHKATKTASYAFYFDPESGSVIIEGGVDRSVFSSVLSDFPGKVEYRNGGAFTRGARNNDVAPFWGGAQVGTGGGSWQCSTGFTVKVIATGVRYMMTAGHCFVIGTNVFSPGGAALGRITHRRPFPQRDMEMIGTKTYDPYIYVGNLAGVAMAVGGAADSQTPRW